VAGVDVPGPSCQLVLIDRIPFPTSLDEQPREITRAGRCGATSTAR